MDRGVMSQIVPRQRKESPSWRVTAWDLLNFRVFSDSAVIFLRRTSLIRSVRTLATTLGGNYCKSTSICNHLMIQGQRLCAKQYVHTVKSLTAKNAKRFSTTINKNFPYNGMEVTTPIVGSRTPNELDPSNNVYYHSRIVLSFLPKKTSMVISLLQ